MERRLLAAMIWAGRAHMQLRTEHRFLLYAVALETLLLRSSSETDLTYRLKTRCAHLVGRSVDSRRQITSQVGKLYSVRSKIVHAGSESVEANQLQLLRALTLRCIVQCLRSAKVRTLVSEDSLEDWFEAKVLR